MARPYRLQGEGFLYHITSRGDDRKKIFISDHDFNKFLEYLKYAQSKYKFYLYAYCLMSNHYHLLLETTQPNLSKIMQYVNTAYTIYYNKKRNKCGHVFQGRYKSILVEADTYFKELTRYIHLNPERAKIVQTPGKYKWSSYNLYINNKSSDLIDIRRVKQLLDLNFKQYRYFVESSFDKPIDPFKNAYAGFILGGKGYIKEKLADLGILAADKDFAYKKTLLSHIDPDAIVNEVAKYYKQDVKTIKTSNKRPMTAKKMAIYLLRTKTNLTNNQIGEIFNMKFSAVSKAAVDFERQIEKNKQLAKAVKEITSKVEV
ncbi:MAG: transposase [Candidatus Omnitrophica bacterium]|nr:transposase [Candidatus Omnitrophota bacterium]